MKKANNDRLVHYFWLFRWVTRRNWIAGDGAVAITAGRMICADLKK